MAQERLGRDGFRLIADLQRAEESDLMRRYGAEGVRLWRLARGVDPRPVSADHETRSISAETTFLSDLSRAEELAPILMELCEKVAFRLKKEHFSARSVTLKLKTADFRLRTRTRSGFGATQLSERLFDMARALLAPELDGAAFRLIGIGAGDLAPAGEADQADLLHGDYKREKARERAIDALREKFGKAAVVRGLAFRGKTDG